MEPLRNIIKCNKVHAYGHWIFTIKYESELFYLWVDGCAQFLMLWNQIEMNHNECSPTSTKVLDCLAWSKNSHLTNKKSSLSSYTPRVDPLSCCSTWVASVVPDCSGEGTGWEWGQNVTAEVNCKTKCMFQCEIRDCGEFHRFRCPHGWWRSKH